jgi:hypothetical protein
LLNKLLSLILLFPLASAADPGYTEAARKIGEIIYDNSQFKKDIDYKLGIVKAKVPENVRLTLEFIIPTTGMILQNKYELRYVRGF